MLALVAAALYAHRENLTYGILGLDSYMQIIAARIESWSDFWGTFGEPLTDGRIGPKFYRPWQNLSIALDYGVSGLEPLGYQVQTLTVFATSIALFFLATRRMLGGSVGAWIACAVFALHPNLINVLPAPCRRSEIWVVLFLLATLWVLPLARDERVRPRLALAALFVLLAAASKETGAMGAGLVLLHQFFLRFEGPLSARVRDSVRAAAPALGTTVAFIAARTWVLGGAGGYLPTKDDASFLTNLSENLRALAVDLFLPNLVPADAGNARWWAVGCAVLFTLLVALAARRAPDGRIRAVVLLGLAWSLPPLAVLGARGWYGPWYATIPLAGGSLALAALIESVIRRPAKEFRTWGARAAVALLVAPPLLSSPLARHYSEWRGADLSLRRVLRSLDEQMLTATAGDVVLVEPEPYYHAPHARRLRWVATISDRGLQAYAEMRWPQKNPKARFIYGPAGLRKNRPNGVTIAVQWVSFDP